MILRKKVIIEGISYRWSTNLDDPGIREFYEKYSEGIKEMAIDEAASPGAIRIPLRFGLFDFKEGFCFWSATDDDHTLIYRTHYEWEIWDARQHELHELAEEQEIALSVEEQLLSTEDDHLKEKTGEAITRKDFDLALRLIQSRIDIRLNCTRQKEFSYLWRIRDLRGLWWAYTDLPTSAPGIEFLWKYNRQLGTFMDFAHWFGARCGLERELCLSETLRIYEAAKRLYPDDGCLARHECLFLRRMEAYELAIQVCSDALQRGLKDNTKSGFAGRLKRLKSEVQRRC